MSKSEFDPRKKIYGIEIEPFTEEELALACAGNRLNEQRFVRTVNDKKSVRGTIILGRFPLYFEMLKDQHPDFPIRWADHISPSFDAKSRLHESTLYTHEPFLFKVQEHSKMIRKRDHKCDCEMIQVTVRVEATRKEDNVIVLGGVFQIFERQDPENN